MRKILLLTFLLLAGTPRPSLSQSISIRNGDTLSGIAIRYNVSIRSLMDLNELYDADNLKVGQRLKLPQEAELSAKASNEFHTVKSGETISEIAIKYKVKALDILFLNNISNQNYLQIGQKLVLPIGAIKPIDFVGMSVPSYHIVKNGDTLKGIAKRYNLNFKDLLQMNNISNKNLIKVGEKIHLHEQKIVKNGTKLNLNKNLETNIEWRDYGSLKINWSDWESVDGSLIAPALNKDGQPIFLAVNCMAHKINSTGLTNQWKDWFSPNNDFEYNLIDDLCKY